MSDSFKILASGLVDLNALASGHGLTGNWYYPEDTGIQRNADPNFLAADRRAIGKWLDLGQLGLTMIYADSGPDQGKVKFLDNAATPNVVSARAAFLLAGKSECDRVRNVYVDKTDHLGSTLSPDPGRDKVAFLYGYLSSVRRLAVAKSKTQDVVQNDIHAKVDANKDYATVKSELEGAGEWNTTFSATEEKLLKRIVNGARLDKWLFDLDAQMATTKTNLDTFEQDTNNTDEQLRDYAISFTSVVFPTIETF